MIDHVIKVSFVLIDLVNVIDPIVILELTSNYIINNVYCVCDRSGN